MKIELNDQEANLVLQALGEMPARVSYMLLQNLGNQIAAENRRRQEQTTEAPRPHMPPWPGNSAGDDPAPGPQ